MKIVRQLNIWCHVNMSVEIKGKLEKEEMIWLQRQEYESCWGSLSNTRSRLKNFVKVLTLSDRILYPYDTEEEEEEEEEESFILNVGDVYQNYQNRAWFDKVIAKIKWCSFLLKSTVLKTAAKLNLRTYVRQSSNKKHRAISLRLLSFAVYLSILVPCMLSSLQSGQILLARYYSSYNI